MLMSFDPLLRFFFFPSSFLLLLLSLPIASEKTLCERKLAQVPANVFYYQRTESAGGAVQCAARCVEDWEFCRSALLIQEKGKSLCQLYGVSMEQLLPLQLPQLTPTQMDPEQLLPITLIELADPPCSSKFSSNARLLASLGAETKDALALIPRPSAKKKFFQQHNNNHLEDSVLGGPKKGANWKPEESSSLSLRGGFSEDDKATYLTPNLEDKFAEERPPAAASFDSFGPSPIRPSFVSRGFEPWRSRCRNGFCGPNAAAPFNNAAGGQQPCAARKSTDPCAPQPHWLEWTAGSCSVSCGNGTRERRRYCSSGTQSDCPGEDTDSERCVMPTCDQWTDWTEWSRCSASCGGGRRLRQRVCRNGDKCPGPSTDSRSCNDDPCPSWSEWDEWGQCSASCGRGTQRRVRECQPKEAECAGPASEHRQCELRLCPSWGDWDAWSSCSKSCGGGESVRHRECQEGTADECRGPAVEHLLCNTQPCPAWSPWSEWSACSKSCGDGSTKLRRRECRYNGLASEDCPGQAQEEAECRLGECPAWTEWTIWSECSTSCGHGHQTRSRKCRPNGFGCPGGDREVRFCQKAVCPYFDNWTEWGGCSVTCGQGFCERRRNCIKEADLGRNSGAGKEPLPMKENGGEEAENESEQGGAGGHALPEDITAADSLSSQKLQVAQSAATVAIDRRRSPLTGSTRQLMRDDGNGSTGDCVGPDVERKPCDAGPCCEWGDWSQWSNCRVRCGNSGFRERSRSCQLQEDYQPSRGGQGGGGGSFFRNPFSGVGQCPVCVGESHQTETCAIPAPARLCADKERPRELRARPEMRQEGEEEGGEETGGALAKMRDEPREAKKCHWTEWGPWTECEHCRKKRKRQCVGAQQANGDGCECAGRADQLEACQGKNCKDTEEGENGGQKKRDKEADEADDCYWTDWSDWSVCDGHQQMRNRSRMCAGLRALAKDCQCQGPILEQSPCPPPPAAPAKVGAENLKIGGGHSLIKRLQLTPRHKQSRAQKLREEQQKKKGTSDLVKRAQPAVGEECDQWMEWGPWGECRGQCGREGLRSRTRDCKCLRGCAGIAVESISCQPSDC